MFTISAVGSALPFALYDLAFWRIVGSSFFFKSIVWIANRAITASFPSLADRNLSATYVIYTIFAALSIPFVLRFVKETKGKTLEEMG